MHNSPFMAFADECSRSCRGHMWRNNNLRIFPAWMMTNTHNRSLPLALNPLQISGFHVLYTHTRVSIRHVCRFYQMRCYPSASLVPAPSSLVLLSGCPLSLSVSLGHTVISVGPSVHRRYSGSGRPLPSLPFLPLSYLIINHCSEAKLLYHHIASFRSVGRKQEGAGVAQPSGDDRGCVSWAPMGGSTVP